MKSRSRWMYLIFIITLIFVSYLVFGPISMVVKGSFFTGSPWDVGNFTLQHFADVFTEGKYIKAFYNTLEIGFIAVLIAGILGFAFSWLVSRSDVPCKALIRTANYVPLVFPTFLGAIGWGLLARPRVGLFNVFLVDYFPPNGPFNIYSVKMIGVILGLYLVPVAYTLLTATMTNMDSSMEDSARISGASTITMIRTVTFPLMKPAVLASLIYVFIMAVENFGVAMILGRPVRINVLLTQLYVEQVYSTPTFGGGSVIALLLLLSLTAMSSLYYKTTQASYKYVTVTGKSTRRTLVHLGKFRYVAFSVWVVYFLMCIVLPFGAIVYMSFLPYPDIRAAQYTLSNYGTVFNMPTLLRAVYNSFAGVSFTAVIALIFAVIITLLVHKTRIPFRKSLDFIASIPISIPGIIMGMGLLFFWVGKNVGVYGSIWIVIICLFTHYLPLSVRTVSNSMLQVSSELEEASLVLGAGEGQTMFYILAPLLRKSLVVGFLLIWLYMFRQMGAVAMVYSFGSEMLPVAVMQQWDAGKYNLTAALATIQATIAMVIVSIYLRLTRKYGD